MTTTNRGGDHPHPPGYPWPRPVPRWRAWLAARLVRLARRLIRGAP